MGEIGRASIRGAVLSVGGSEQPLVKALTWYPAQFVLFVVSPQSESQVHEKILPALNYQPQYEVLRVSSPEDLNNCYVECRRGIYGWLQRRGLRGEEVYVDNTGGTKPMSAAVAMAAFEWIPHYHYVSGERDKGGLGIVQTGTESSVSGISPWFRFALKPRELATHFYRQGYVEQAAQLLEQAAESATEQQQTIKAYAALCRLLARLDALKFDGLTHELGKWRSALQVAFEQADNKQALRWLLSLPDHFAQLQKEVKEGREHRMCLRELLACARRRARQGHYDEAVARLYRAIELFVQDRLHRAFGAQLGIVHLDKLDAELAQRLRRQFPNAVDEQGRLRLSLKNGCEALGSSPYEEDRDIPKLYQSLKDELEMRNQSWLAHGTRSASREDFQRLWSKVLPAVGLREEDVPEWPDLSFAL